MFERIRHMLIKEFIQVFRDPKMKGVIFLMPIIQVLVFGYAVTTDVKHVATAVYDLDNSVASRELPADLPIQAISTSWNMSATRTGPVS